MATAAEISAAQIVKYHAVRVGGGPVVPSFAGSSMAAEGLGMWRRSSGSWLHSFAAAEAAGLTVAP